MPQNQNNGLYWYFYELFKSFLNCSNWLDISRPSKKPTYFLEMKQAIRVQNKHR